MLGRKARITRESPAYPIIDRLKELGANVQVFDPYVPKESTADSLDAALDFAECLVIVTDHQDFERIHKLIDIYKNIKIIIDGRNLMDKKIFENNSIVYLGIGR